MRASVPPVTARAARRVGREQTEKKRNDQVEDKYPEPGNEHVFRPAIDDITGVGRTGVRRPQWSSRIAFVQGEASGKPSRSTVTAAFFWNRC